MPKIFLALTVAALLALPATARAGDLTFSINGGLVTLVAEDVPLSTILAEWARIGQVKIVNGEQILTKVTLHIENTPEKKALDIVLRSAAGYMAAERPVPMAGVSAFDRIMILPTSRAPAGSPAVAAAPAQFAPPPVPVPDMDDDIPEPIQSGPVMPMGDAMSPVNGQPQPGMPTAPGAQPGAQPGSLTAPRPGMLPPPPQQPVPFGTPRPGGPGGPGGRGGGPGGAPNPNLPGGGDGGH